jgi:NAD(P)H-dependent flavin oxidoreductase YrpB (nitropropane dioxygenase family)
VKAVIDAAHKRGKLAVVHIGNENDARAVLEAGADGLVHLFPGESADAAGPWRGWRQPWAPS